MKYLIIPIIILLSLSTVFAQNQVCCHSFGYGTGMIRCCDKYELMMPEECIVPEGFTGGGKEIVSNEFCTGNEWLTKIKTIYSNYIDSGQFFVMAITIFFPIIITGLFGIIANIKGVVSMFILSMILGILMFLVYPYLSDILVGVMT